MAKDQGLDCDSYSFRISEKEDNDIIYTSDVDSLTHLRPDPGKTQILITECTHVSLAEIIDFACSAGINRVVLTHIPPEFEEDIISIHGQQESIKIEVAKDGLVIEV